ncbi:hypothetical protein [Sphingomonas sp. 179-A 2A2 NHS]|uniref:hypothetical protein n=1 Tax=Sphingomonas sp. 179-A 2A2 NHS TaxID=3374290 RepID=UPI00387A1312
MKLQFIELDKLYVDNANMRFAKRPPDVSDILPSVRKRGILQTLIVRPGERTASAFSPVPAASAPGN